MHQVVALAPEERVLLEPDEDVEVARRAAAHARLALAGDTKLLPVVDARRDGETDLAILALATLAAAVAGPARGGGRSRFRAAPLAALAGLETRHGDHALAALDGVEEVDLDLHSQVRAAHRAARLPTAQVPAEERLEEIADPEIADPAGRRAEHVVALAALRIGE